MSKGKSSSNQNDEESNFEYVIREAYGEIFLNISSIRDTMKRRTSNGEKTDEKQSISLLPMVENQTLVGDEEGKFMDTRTKTGRKEPNHELGQRKQYSIAKNRLESLEGSSSSDQNAENKSGKTSWRNDEKDNTGKTTEKHHNSKKSSYSKLERDIRKALAQMRMQNINSETEAGMATSDGRSGRLTCKTLRTKNDILYVVKGDV